jgi:hypothetical protein
MKILKIVFENKFYTLPIEKVYDGMLIDIPDVGIVFISSWYKAKLGAPWEPEEYFVHESEKAFLNMDLYKAQPELQLTGETK